MWTVVDEEPLAVYTPRYGANCFFGVRFGIVMHIFIVMQLWEFELMKLVAIAGLKIDEFSRGKMDATAKELMEEKSLAYSCLN